MKNFAEEIELTYEHIRLARKELDRKINQLTKIENMEDLDKLRKKWREDREQSGSIY
jgi:hypothetical protein